MCYDISFSTNLKVIADYIPDLKGVEQLSVDFQPSYHLMGMSYPEWPVVLYEMGPMVAKAEWGVVAPYMKTPADIAKSRKYMLNARAEKILDKSTYWNKIRHQRCLIPVTGYFEHRDVPGIKNKVPYYIKVKDRELTFIAGLWTYSALPTTKDGEDDIRLTFTLITRAANDLLRTIHNAGEFSNRMPHVLPKQLQQDWINPEATDIDIAAVLNYEVPSKALEAWPVHTIRGRNHLEGEAIIQKKEYPGLDDIQLGAA